MDRRLELHELLLAIMDEDEKNVYYQAPPNTGMKYPCIKYDLDDLEVSFADNKPYKRVKRWEIMVIDSNPDSDIWERIAALPMCTFDRKYTAENLYHFVLHIYF